ncbi:hypothetical protein HNV12_03335 [Methanococcoides sp. SA1]|nr:hypothetical protein [Methanococcoides sp. SA1]
MGENERESGADVADKFSDYCSCCRIRSSFDGYDMNGNPVSDSYVKSRVDVVGRAGCDYRSRDRK